MDNLHQNSMIVAESQGPNTSAREDPTEMGSENILLTKNRKRKVPIYMLPTGLTEKVEGADLALYEKMDCKGDETSLIAPDHSSAPILNRPKCRRMLFTDPTKISSKDMRAQLSDVTDTLQSLILAPPTKELMKIKGTDYVNKLFALPGRPIPARSLLKSFQDRLTSEESQRKEKKKNKDSREFLSSTSYFLSTLPSTSSTTEHLRLWAAYNTWRRRASETPSWPPPEA